MVPEWTRDGVVLPGPWHFRQELRHDPSARRLSQVLAERPPAEVIYTLDVTVRALEARHVRHQEIRSLGIRHGIRVDFLVIGIESGDPVADGGLAEDKRLCRHARPIGRMGQYARANLDAILSGRERHVPPIARLHAIRHGNADVAPVDDKRHVAHIRERHHVYRLVREHRHARAHEPQLRLWVPVRLVQVERVLGRLAVIRDESLVVDAVPVCLVPPVGGEVEHHPREYPPDGRIALHAMQGAGVQIRLVLFGIGIEIRPRARKRIAMLADGRPASELADRDHSARRHFRQHAANGIRQVPSAVTRIPRLKVVPARIQVESLRVRYAVYRPAQGVAPRRDRRARSVVAFDLRVYLLQQGDGRLHRHVLAALPENLVVEPPHHDGRAVPVLGDHLPRHDKGVRAEGLGEGKLVYERELRPYEKAARVAEPIELGGMWIVRRPHGVRAHPLDPVHVLRQVGRRHGPALPVPVLVLVHAMKLPPMPIQVKAVRSEFYRAEPERLLHLVAASRPLDPQRQLIEVRILRRPEPRIREIEFLHFVLAAKHRDAGHDVACRRIWLKHDP